MSGHTEVARVAVQAGQGHAWDLLIVEAAAPCASLLWLPALGVAARHYLPFAHALAVRGITVGLHEWRGHGSSSVRASRSCNWGYRELLETDIPASVEALEAHAQDLPRVIGGHSLGGQLASCHLSLRPRSFEALWLVASGAPYWRAFPAPLRFGLPLAYRFLPWLARANGVLPGRRIGFGGNESAGVMRDWSRTALTGRYDVQGWQADIENGFNLVAQDITAVTVADDWLAPPESLRFLLDKLPRATRRVSTLEARQLGTGADHFGWMQAPDAVAEALAVGTGVAPSCFAIH